MKLISSLKKVTTLTLCALLITGCQTDKERAEESLINKLETLHPGSKPVADCGITKKRGIWGDGQITFKTCDAVYWKSTRHEVKAECSIEDDACDFIIPEDDKDCTIPTSDRNA